MDALTSGDSLFINDKGLVNSNSEQIVKFSKTFLWVKESLEKKGYRLIDAKVRFLVFWKNKNEKSDVEKEIKIVLPELYFEK